MRYWGSFFDACLLYPLKTISEVTFLKMTPVTRPASEFQTTRSPTRKLRVMTCRRRRNTPPLPHSIATAMGVPEAERHSHSSLPGNRLAMGSTPEPPLDEEKEPNQTEWSP